MFYSDDPIRDYDRYCEHLESELAKLPKCVDCNNPIQDDDYYDVDGEYLCESCMKDRYRRSTEDYINDR